MKRSADGQLPDRPPGTAGEIFGSRLPLAEEFAQVLADTGVSHGLIGPRETPRLWERHLLNCGIVESVLPHRTRLVDVGSGAGLPGVVLAIARPDVEVVLIEPMLRRTTWLEQTVGQLGLTNVQVCRGRAQDFWGKLRVPVVTARAVARLGELSAWCLPLLEPEGNLLALKGASAATELEEDESLVARAGGSSARVVLLGEEVLPEPTRLIEVRIGDRVVRAVPPAESSQRSGKRAGKGRPRGGSGKKAGGNARDGAAKKAGPRRGSPRPGHSGT